MCIRLIPQAAEEYFWEESAIMNAYTHTYFSNTCVRLIPQAAEEYFWEESAINTAILIIIEGQIQVFQRFPVVNWY
jgi:hypothetical protein